jgi:hypothetical protein
MLSSVSKLADKNFIIGFYVPALLAFLTLVYAFNAVPWVSSLSKTIAKSDKNFANLTYVAAAVWVLALILLICSHALYRVLEGYSPPFAWFPKMSARHRDELRRLRLRQDYLINDGDRVSASRVNWRLNTDYPPSEGFVLPTRFGNRIRAFELYPNKLYGADGVTLWPRLLTVLPASEISSINDARAQVNCMMNACYLALFVALATAIRLIFEAVTRSQANPPDTAKLACVLMLASLLVLVAYAGATAAVVAWGETVKSAFDCFLPALAKQLGYALPAHESDRKDFWNAIARLLLYREPLADGAWPSAAPPPESS